MKKTLIYLCGILALWGCSENPNFVLKGKYQTTQNKDTLYLYYETDRGEKIDTIWVNNGDFHYEKSWKSPRITYLLRDTLSEQPLFVENNSSFEVHLDSIKETYTILKGGKVQNTYATLKAQLDTLTQIEQQKVVKTFIGKHPFSLVSVFCIKHYYLPFMATHADQIEKLIQSLSGDLQDLPQVRRWFKQIKAKKNYKIGRRMPSFNLETKEGKRTHLSDYKKGYLLITFWASWQPQSKTDIALKKKFFRLNKKRNRKKKHAIFFLDISLDQNKKAWLEAIKKDTLIGTQCCDLKGWNQFLFQKFKFDKLPANLLVNKNRIICAKNIHGDSLSHKIKELIKKEK